MPVPLPPRLQTLVNAGQMTADQAHAQAMVNDKNYAQLVAQDAGRSAGPAGGQQGPQIAGQIAQPGQSGQPTSPTSVQVPQSRFAIDNFTPGPATSLPGMSVDPGSGANMPGEGAGGGPPDIKAAIDQLRQKLDPSLTGAQPGGGAVGAPTMSTMPAGNPNGTVMTRPAVRPLPGRPGRGGAAGPGPAMGRMFLPQQQQGPRPMPGQPRVGSNPYSRFVGRAQ